MNTQRFKILQYEIDDVAANGDTIMISASCVAQCENGLIFGFGIYPDSEDDVTGAYIEGYPIISMPTQGYHIRAFQENDVSSPSSLVGKLFLEDGYVRLNVEGIVVKINEDNRDLHAHELSLSKIAEWGFRIGDMVVVESFYKYNHFHVDFEVTQGTENGEISAYGDHYWYRGK